MESTTVFGTVGEGSSPSRGTVRTGGRVVYCNGLENRRTERYREFESLPVRICAYGGISRRTSLRNWRAIVGVQVPLSA